MTTNIFTAVVTAYIATGHLCSDGTVPTVATTIALPRRFALGSTVIIAEHRYIGTDRTNRRYDGRFDIFVSTKKSAILWGKRTLQVTIITNP